MFAVYCDEIITNADRQLIRGEMLHIHINDIAILFQAHLNTYSRAVSQPGIKTHKNLV